MALEITKNDKVVGEVVDSYARIFTYEGSNGEASRVMVAFYVDKAKSDANKNSMFTCEDYIIQPKYLLDGKRAESFEQALYWALKDHTDYSTAKDVLE